eukprot:CAMPEP_0181175324 /NCGR_PEP_ID=MMETSP1096-20121128/4017_1 /TAXON_ID=156174 ORGANISM="Chrysochromulina ericina, Strain CCMP281" /NCGR_SAMPLE_ID=MMETSP1096 /ASSEMBLY_ACC=CAM_ASM_000453 /LENGTH=84 /DNA_ID=CAMNT_0023263301 /DNA_START=234 /DNA_END=485 /DNA_ORIENTATION=+
MANSMADSCASLRPMPSTKRVVSPPDGCGSDGGSACGELRPRLPHGFPLGQMPAKEGFTGGSGSRRDNSARASHSRGERGMRSA